MIYKLIGIAVVKGLRWYLHERFGVLASRWVATAGIVGVGIAGVLVARRAKGD